MILGTNYPLTNADIELSSHSFVCQKKTKNRTQIYIRCTENSANNQLTNRKDKSNPDRNDQN